MLAIAAEFGRSKGELGVVLTLVWAVYACLQFPSGVFADRYGERRIILFALAALILGSGAGLYFAAGTALLDERFESTGQAFSLHSAGAPATRSASSGRRSSSWARWATLRRAFSRKSADGHWQSAY